MENKLFSREIEVGEDTLSIFQGTVGDVGCVVWDAALVFVNFMNTVYFADHFPLQGRKSIELGSGTGVVGISASVYGADVILSDLPELQRLLKKNINENKNVTKGNLSAEILAWGDIVSLPYELDYIFISDCVYYHQSLEPLVQTMVKLSSYKTTIFMSYEKRTSKEKIILEEEFMKMIDKSFTKEEIPIENHDPVYRSDDIRILVLKLK